MGAPGVNPTQPTSERVQQHETVPVDSSFEMTTSFILISTRRARAGRPYRWFRGRLGGRGGACGSMRRIVWRGPAAVSVGEKWAEKQMLVLYGTIVFWRRAPPPRGGREGVRRGRGSHKTPQDCAVRSAGGAWTR